MSKSPSPAAGPPGAAPAVDPDKLDATVLKISAVVVLGAIMSILDITVVSVALPTFQQVFGSDGVPQTYAAVAWTMTAYTLALATVIPVTGWASDRFGTKRLYIVALVLFILGSVACAFAWDLPSLIGFRVLQGLGGGMLMPLGMTIMTRAAGPRRIGRVMAVLGVPMLLGPIAGPILGGWLIEVASWHWIFIINLPLGIIALIVTLKVLPSDAPKPSESFDFVGMLLLSPGLALFLFGVSSIPEAGTVAATKVLVPGLIGLALVVAFVFHALRKKGALIDLSLFKNRQLTIAVITMAIFIVAFMGSGLLFPSYFMQVRGESTLMAGLLIAPQGLGAMLTMPLAGKLVDKIGPGKIVIVGLALIAVGMGSFSQLSADTSYWILGGSLAVMGMGMGATMMPLMTAALATLTDHQIARGSTLMNIVQQTAGSIGTAVMSVVLTAQLASHALASPAIASQADEQAASMFNLSPAQMLEGLGQAADSFGVTFLLATALVLVALIPTFFLPRKPISPPSADDADAAANPAASAAMMH
ncbi:DHA2 family efflux MFS transporter permease subunit [Tomitella biformata]|uniref:DHA2 family efflux MFS transporter permease subunit n=1 Tax=Tomitella biformata TaxID=630403 RepID=UPI00046442C6|nr:DHA2 family efflux MFS transporter permease subunit [Tomitella biformata]